MRSSARMGAVLGAVLLVAGWSWGGEVPGRGVGCSGVAVVDAGSGASWSPGSGLRGGRVGEFRASEVEDLEFRVALSGRLVGDHVMTVRVYTPRGHLYREASYPVSPGGGSRSEGGRDRMVRLSGYPYPVKVIRPVTAPAGVMRPDEVRVRFPVAGTTIVSSGLYGRWRVEVYWDGSDTPCAAPTWFAIAP